MRCLSSIADFAGFSCKTFFFFKLGLTIEAIQSNKELMITHYTTNCALQQNC